MMTQSDRIILGIETSCDETAAAVYSDQRGVLSSKLFSQVKLHSVYGGVVPEIASRSHIEKMTVIAHEALTAAGISLDAVDAIAVTTKPGLPGSLLVGLSFAKAIALARNIPLIGVNHLEGHAFSAFLNNMDISFPFICLTASGGHTSLYLVHDFGSYEVIGQTLDDAAGEAFDKIAKLINLPYPGGPIIEQLAQQAAFKDYYAYPRGNIKTLDFSFSGLKTAVLYDMVKRGFYDMAAKQATMLLTPDVTLKIASSLQVAIKDVFVQKLQQALTHYPSVQSVCFVGGVACNQFIKQALSEVATTYGKRLFTPEPRYCTDNAAMIAFVGNYKAAQGKFDTLELDIF